MSIYGRHSPDAKSAAVLRLVLDVRNGWPVKETDREPILEWLRRNGLDHAHIYRIEVWCDLLPFAKIFQYATNPDGQPFCPHLHAHQDEATQCDLAEREPFAVGVHEDFPIPIDPRWLRTISSR